MCYWGHKLTQEMEWYSKTFHLYESFPIETVLTIQINVKNTSPYHSTVLDKSYSHFSQSWLRLSAFIIAKNTLLFCWGLLANSGDDDVTLAGFLCFWWSLEWPVWELNTNRMYTVIMVQWKPHKSLISVSSKKKYYFVNHYVNQVSMDFLKIKPVVF